MVVPALSDAKVVALTKQVEELSLERDTLQTALAAAEEKHSQVEEKFNTLSEQHMELNEISKVTFV